MEQRDIVGKTLHFAYSSETYRIEVLNETQVRWTRTEGENTGQGDTENYAYSRLSPDVALISWVEADGLRLSNAVDFTAKTVTTHASQDRPVFENRGKLTVSG